MRAAIVGIAGPDLRPDEAALFRTAPPAGVILFARNVRDIPQLQALTAALRDVLPPRAVIAVDQEGGRVARLRPPQWRAHPPAQRVAEGGERAAWLTGALIGLDCAEAGITMACAPVLDLLVPGASSVIGDRSFGSDPASVARLGRAMAEGLMAAGVTPVAKHAPGHGRALLDSHHALPAVPAEDSIEQDIAAFRACADLPWMMTAHLLYHRFDSHRPGTLSPAVIEGVIRGRIGFGGVLVSDDLAMRALEGAPAALAIACLEAGCDIALHCTGALADTAAVLTDVPDLAGPSLARFDAAARTVSSRRVTLDGPALAAERERLLGC